MQDQYKVPDHPPERLVEAIRMGDCCLFAGDDLSEMAGYKSREQNFRMLLEWSRESNILKIDKLLLTSTNLDELDYAVDSLTVELKGDDQQNQLMEYLRSNYLLPRIYPSKVHQRLGKIPFNAVITPNLDTLLEQTFAETGREFKGNLFSPLSPDPDASYEFENLKKAYYNKDFFILKLRGSLEKSETVILSSLQFEDMLYSSWNFTEFLSSMLLTKSFFFIGASLDQILNFLKPLKIGVTNQEHYALVLVYEPGFEAKAERLERRYGIRVFAINVFEKEQLSKDEQRDFIQESYLSFLNPLMEEFWEEGKESPTIVSERRTTWLEKVVLEQIGPFEHLELVLDKNWNILLGDNGVGKSTIIRAIALGLLGEEAVSFAGRLIRVGQRSGRIILETNEGKRYTTELLREPGRVRIKSDPVRLLDVEGWLTIGFPPARIASWATVKPLQEQVIHQTSAKDITPLIAGGADPRLDYVKSWFMDIDYKMKSNPDRDYEKLRDSLMDVIRKVAVGVKVEYSRVDPEIGGVYFLTDDGEVTIDAISQGTASLIGWVGYLAQRLFEVYPDQDQKEAYALVMVDEIDAHMHPLWQQSLVGNLRTLFPKIQFIVTTHSPLVVGGVDIHHVIRLVRDQFGNIIRLSVPADMTMGRTDQVLTSSLFGLGSSLDPITEQELKKYHNLLRKTQRTNRDNQKLQALRNKLEFRIPVPLTMPEERRAQELVRALLDAQVGDKYPESKQLLLEKAEQLLNEVLNKRKVSS